MKCCVEGCEDALADDVTYFTFPASRVLRRKWIAAVGGGRPRAGALVCSRHFRRADTESARGRTRLRAGAVPSVFGQTNRKRQDSTSSDDLPIANAQSKLSTTASDDKPAPTESDKKDDQKEKENKTDQNEEENKIEINIDEKILRSKHKNDEIQHKRKNLHEKLKSLHNKNKSLLNKSKSDDLNDKSDDFQPKSGKQNKSDELESKSEGLESKSDGLESKSDGLQNKSDDKECKDESPKDEDILGAVRLQKKDGCEERVQEKCAEKGEEPLGGEGEVSQSKKSGDAQDKCIESALQLPDGPRDIDKAEDIEELLTNYHIKQDRALNIHGVTDAPPTPPAPPAPPAPADQPPVFIEISVDKDNNCSVDKADCLMVMESVQVELDPSELLLPDRECDMETVEIEDVPPAKDDPISLLTSSDEDDVIIEEPHIDTVEVSDETDEDDVPLVKLLKRRRAEKKTLAELVPSGEDDLAKILWGMYEYYCVQCHYTTSSGTEYRRHTASHAKVLMMCQICGYMTASESQFTKHEKQHGEKKYKCHLCTYKAKHNMSLLYHLKGHKAEDFLKGADVSVVKRGHMGRVFECRNCDYTTKKRCDLKRHMTRRHKKNDDEDFIP